MTRDGEAEAPPSPEDHSIASKLGRILDEYLRAMEEGRPVSAAAIAALHPEIADRFLACVPVLELTNRTAAEFNSRFDLSATARLDDFELIRRIGRGGMGVVFEARQISLNRRVALKILPLDASLDDRRSGRFLVEARAAGRLHHPHIVPVFSVGRDQGLYFYAMRLIEGRSLADLIGEFRGETPAPDRTTVNNAADASPTPETMMDEGASGLSHPDPGTDADSESASRPPPAETSPRHRLAVDFGIQAADALEHAHRQGVIHRDVKPLNLMIDAQGNLWITDFGLARMEFDSDLTRTGDILGTLRYMSPEQHQADHSRVDHRTDVYSLGATLYELLTLRPVREATSLEPIEPRPPRAWDRSIPRDLETIVLRALTPDPEERYATAGDLADDLRRFREGRSIRARRAGLGNRARRWIGRHKPFVASMAMVGPLALAAAAAAFSMASKNRDHVRAERRAAYVRDVNQASQLIRRNFINEAADILARHVPEPGDDDNRTFAWRHLWRLAHIRPRLLEGHAGDVYHLEYSPDGRTLATAGQDGTARLWDAATGALVRAFEGHEGDVDWVTFSPDGETLATSGDDGSVRLWSVRGEGPSTIIDQQVREVVAVVFTPDGRELISGDDAGRVRFWDVATGLERGAAPSLNTRIQSLAISPDGRTLATAAERPGLRLIDVQAPGRATDLPGFLGVYCAAFSHDGRLVAGGDKMGDLKIVAVDAPSSQPRAMERPADFAFSIEGLAFSPNDRALAACGRGGFLCVWDVETGRILRVHRSGRRRLWGVAFSPDGRTLAACGVDGAVELWDLGVAPGRETTLPPLTINPAFPPLLGEKGLTVIDGEPAGPLHLTTWDPTTNQAVNRREVEAPPRDLVALSPDGSLVALYEAQGDPLLRIVSTTGRASPPPLEHPPELTPNGVGAKGASLLFSADGSHLAARVDYRGLFVWDASTGRLKAKVFDGVFQSIAFSPRGNRLAIVGDGLLWILHLANGRIDDHPNSGQGHPGPIAFAPDGQTIAVGFPNTKTLAFWRLDDPERGPTLLELPEGPLALAFSPGGRTLASAGALGGLNLINSAALAPIATLDAPRGPALALAFSADGLTLLGLFTPTSLAAWTADPDIAAPLAPDFAGR